MRFITLLLMLGALSACHPPIIDQTVQGVTLQAEQPSEAVAELARVAQALDACEDRQAHSSWVMPTSFTPDDLTCTVRGTVYAEQGKIALSGRSDGCQMIRVELQDNGMTLRYRGRFAFLVFPPDGGHMPFAYRWGSMTATIAGKEVNVFRGEG